LIKTEPNRKRSPLCSSDVNVCIYIYIYFIL
jgi:hypothetical protein